MSGKVQAARVGRAERGGLLGEHVGVVVERLEGEQRADRGLARRSGRQRRECGGALEVRAFGQRGQHELAQRGIGDCAGAGAGAVDVRDHARVDRQPVARGEQREGGEEREALAGRRPSSR